MYIGILTFDAQGKGLNEIHHEILGSWKIALSQTQRKSAPGLFTATGKN